MDGKIYCLVDRAPLANVSNTLFDLDSQQFYILLAIGDDVTVTSINQHKQRQVASEPFLLRDIVNLTQADKPLLIKLHGCFMIFAWMGTASIGLVLARYFKQEWTGKQFMGKDLWFTVGIMYVSIVHFIFLIDFSVT